MCIRDSVVIVVTHDQRILRYADALLRMDDGRIVGDRSNTSVSPAEGA